MGSDTSVSPVNGILSLVRAPTAANSPLQVASLCLATLWLAKGHPVSFGTDWDFGVPNCIPQCFSYYFPHIIFLARMTEINPSMYVFLQGAFWAQISLTKACNKLFSYFERRWEPAMSDHKTSFSFVGRDPSPAKSWKRFHLLHSAKESVFSHRHEKFFNQCLLCFVSSMLRCGETKQMLVAW